MKFKKLASLFLACAMVAGMSVGAFADKNHPVNSSTIGNVNDAEIVDVTETEIQYSEYIAKLAKSKSMSLEEAVNFDQNQNLGIMKNIQSNSIDQRQAGYSYRDITWTVRYSANSNFAYQTTVSVKLYGDYIYYEIIDVMGLDSRPISGIGSYDLIVENQWTDAQNGIFPTTDLQVYARCYFEVYHDYEIGGEGTLLPGFTISGNAGGHSYERSNSVTLNTTWHPY